MKLLFCALAILLAAPKLLAQGKTAQVSALEGRAQKSRAGGAPVQLRLGAAVVQGDTIETSDTARLEIRFSDNSVLRLGPKARLLLAESHFAAGPARRRMTAKLFFGNLWAKVTSVIHGDQRFQIETENAVAGVRGTEFRVEVAPKQEDLVRVYEGVVQVDGKDWSHRVAPAHELRFGKEKPAGPREFDPASEKGHRFMEWVRSRRDEVRDRRPDREQRRERRRREH